MQKRIGEALRKPFMSTRFVSQVAFALVILVVVASVAVGFARFMPPGITEYWTMVQAVAVTVTLAFIALQAHLALRQLDQNDRTAKVERTIALIDRASTLRLGQVIRRLRRQQSYVESGKALGEALKSDDNPAVNRQGERWEDAMALFSYFLGVEKLLQS